VVTGLVIRLIFAIWQSRSVGSGYRTPFFFRERPRTCPVPTSIHTFWMSMKKVRKSALKRRSSKIPALDIDETREETIFPACRHPLSRAEVHAALDPVVRAWLRVTCDWSSGGGIGDYRFVSMSTEVAPDTHVYVQFWAEPDDVVLWEVSSGRWNPPADKWLEGERSRRIESFGFEIGGEAENYQREIHLRTPADYARVARTVVDIFWSAFEYRGLTPIEAIAVYESRAQEKPVHEELCADDLARLFRACGFRVDKWVPEGDEEDVDKLRCRKYGTTTIVRFEQPSEHEGFYHRVFLEVDLPVPPEEAERLREAEGRTGDPAMEISTMLVFMGGVTVEWIVGRLLEWDGMLKAHRRAVPRRRVRQERERVTVH
jgi:hypothetical protein